MSVKRMLILSVIGGALAACSEQTAPPSATTGPDASAERVASVVAGNTWSTKAPMRAGRAFMGAAAGGGFLYVVGGISSETGGAVPTTTLQAYNLSTNTWSTRKSLPFHAAYGAAAFINGKLYAAGGVEPRLYVYNPATNSWTRKADMPHIQSGSAAVINGQLYVYSGTLIRYNPSTNKWTTLPSPPSEAGSAAVGVMGGRLYVAGGQDQSSAPITNVYVYDPATNRWQAKAPMPVPLVDAASAVIDKKLYVATGSPCGACGPVRTVLVYDPVTDTWTTKASIPTARQAPAGVSAQGKFYVLGGWNSSFVALTKVEVYTP